MLTPRDWAVIAQQQAWAAECPSDAAAKLAESKRYSLIATELERLQDACIAQSAALQEAYRSIAFLRTALSRRE